MSGHAGVLLRVVHQKMLKHNISITDLAVRGPFLRSALEKHLTPRKGKRVPDALADKVEEIARERARSAGQTSL